MSRLSKMWGYALWSLVVCCLFVIAYVKDGTFGKTGTPRIQASASEQERREFRCDLDSRAIIAPLNEHCQYGDWIVVPTEYVARYCDVYARIIPLPNGLLCQYLGYVRQDRKPPWDQQNISTATEPDTNILDWIAQKEKQYQEGRAQAQQPSSPPDVVPGGGQRGTRGRWRCNTDSAPGWSGDYSTQTCRISAQR